MADKRKGYVIMWRSSWDNPLFADEKANHYSAWSYLISHASYKDTVIQIRNETIQIKRGQLFTSIRKLAEKWHWDKDTVTRFLRDTENQGMTLTCATHNGTLITLLNYSKYQDFSVSKREYGDTDGDTDTDTGTDTDGDTNAPHINKYKYISKSITNESKKEPPPLRREAGRIYER